MDTYWEQGDKLIHLRAENERLRRERDEANEACAAAVQTLAEYENESERLEAIIDSLKKAVRGKHERAETAEAKVGELEERCEALKVVCDPERRLEALNRNCEQQLELLDQAQVVQRELETSLRESQAREAVAVEIVKAACVEQCLGSLDSRDTTLAPGCGKCVRCRIIMWANKPSPAATALLGVVEWAGQAWDYLKAPYVWGPEGEIPWCVGVLGGFVEKWRGKP